MRTQVKRLLGRLPGGAATGSTFLIYHRVGGGSSDELDVSVADFTDQVDLLADQPVVGIDDACRRAVAGSAEHSVVLTFDDGFQDVYHHAWPLLRDRGLPFTIYLTTAYVGGRLQWAGSTAKEQGAPALTWEQLREMRDSGLCTIGNHTHTHVGPDALDVDELDRCTETVERELGMVPRHFAYTWGVPVPRLATALSERFESCATGELGRNTAATDATLFTRVPVRRTDPLNFFEAKLRGNLGPERAYGAIVSAAKGLGVSG